MPDNLPSSVLEVQSAFAEFIESNLLFGTDDSSMEVSKVQASTIEADPQELARLHAKVREQSKAAGFFYKTQPEEFGGSPAGTLEITMLREMLAASNSPLSSSVFGPGPGILASAKGLLRTDYLEPLMRGEKRGAFGFTEPDTAQRATFAVVDNDDLLITGRKSFVTGGATADFVSILVNVEQIDGTKLGTAMVVVDREMAGVTIDRTFRSMEGGGHVSMTFDKVRVSTEKVIGKIGEGMPRALSNIGNVRLMVSAQATGMCQWVLNFVEQHLKAPHRSGTPLGDKEGVRLRFADMRIETYVARSALYRTARLVDTGVNTVNETIATKVFCTETAGRVVDLGVQLAGGQALVEGHPLEKLYRQVRSLRLVEGASDLLRLNLAKGKLELGKGRL